MALPFLYTARNLRVRWTTALVTILGVAGAVSVFIAVLALARGFRATLVSSGLPSNAIVRRGGADSEMTSILTLEAVRAIEDAPQIARRGSEPRVSAEVVVIAAFPLREGGSDANVQVRGVSRRVLDVRDNVRVVEGRFFAPGLHELVAGQGARGAYAGLELGGEVRFGGATWKVVGILDASGSAFDSELWCDADVLNAAYQRPLGVYQSVTARLQGPDAFPAFAALLGKDPRLDVQVEREIEYYAKQSRLVGALISVLGSLVALAMAVGAVCAALNAMYSAVSARVQEIATLRALGFGSGSVVGAIVTESLLISGLGGLLGCLAAWPLNGLTTGTLNWQTFAHLAFAFQVTPDLLLMGLGFALVMGVLGGLPPALRAASMSVAAALRAL